MLRLHSSYIFVVKNLIATLVKMWVICLTQFFFFCNLDWCRFYLHGKEWPTTDAGLCHRHEDGIGSISERKTKRNNVTGKSILDYAFTDVPIYQSLMSSQHSFLEYNYKTLIPWIPMFCYILNIKMTSKSFSKLCMPGDPKKYSLWQSITQ